MHPQQPTAAQDVATQLADRLARGWVLIEKERDPDRRDHLETHWLSLLHQYEATCDRLAPPDR